MTSTTSRAFSIGRSPASRRRGSRQKPLRSPVSALPRLRIARRRVLDIGYQPRRGPPVELLQRASGPRAKINPADQAAFMAASDVTVAGRRRGFAATGPPPNLKCLMISSRNQFRQILRQLLERATCCQQMLNVHPLGKFFLIDRRSIMTP